MKVAVWDTYVLLKDQTTLHFDVFTSEEMKDPSRVYSFAKQFLTVHHYDFYEINSQNCQFCHVEDTTEELQNAIVSQGYAIKVLHIIPPNLPENPSRRDIILYIRAKYPEHRFADFSTLNYEQVLKLLYSLE